MPRAKRRQLTRSEDKAAAKRRKADKNLRARNRKEIRETAETLKPVFKAWADQTSIRIVVDPRIHDGKL